MEVLEIVVVAVIVAAAALFSAWRLMPARYRLWLIDRLVPGARNSGTWLGRLRREVQAEALDGCHACLRGSARAPRRF